MILGGFNTRHLAELRSEMPMHKKYCAASEFVDVDNLLQIAFLGGDWRDSGCVPNRSEYVLFPCLSSITPR
jgi:hypothetical protein